RSRGVEMLPQVVRNVTALPGRSERLGVSGAISGPRCSRGRRCSEDCRLELPDGVVLEGAVPDLIVLDRERLGGTKHGVADDVRGAGDGQIRLPTILRVLPV